MHTQLSLICVKTAIRLQISTKQCDYSTALSRIVAIWEMGISNSRMLQYALQCLRHHPALLTRPFNNQKKNRKTGKILEAYLRLVTLDNGSGVEVGVAALPNAQGVHTLAFCECLLKGTFNLSSYWRVYLQRSASAQLRRTHTEPPMNAIIRGQQIRFESQ